MGSKRLPNKVIVEFKGKPILSIVIERVSASKKIDSICLAMPDTEENNVLARLYNDSSVEIFRGSEEDVLSRFYYAAKEINADIIVRITPDDLLVDSEIIDDFVEILENSNFDYVSNTIEPTYPEGLDIEVFTFQALERAFKEATLPSEREHVTPYIWKNPELFKIHNVTCSQDNSDMRWTIDEQVDLQFFETLFQKSGFLVESVHFNEILNFLDKHPEIATINSKIKRNAGYLHSIEKEKST